ncbi:haloacid dehalogenase type II [Burkholderia sp. RS01]|uniref:haloacid dehalogenase type II n=1 Tax=unclassified Burkholderia TaxID=2613784 RepID=UPI0032181ADC
MDDSTFVSPSTGRNVKAVLFDTFGTVVDWRAGVAREAKKFANRHGITFEPFDLADKWRADYYPSMAPIRSGDRRYVPLDQLHLENLKTALAALGFPPSDFPDDDLEELNRAWESLPAWPDSVEGLERLKARYIVGPLSNANTALLVNMAKHARLPWDVVIGLDLFQTYKPDPAAYTGVAAVLRLHPGEVMLAAAHNYDLRAAREAGLATAFVRRATEHGPKQTTDLEPASDWDISVDDFTQLAQSLTARPAATA